MLQMIIVFVNGCYLIIILPKVYLVLFFYQANLISLFLGKYVNFFIDAVILCGRFTETTTVGGVLCI